MLLVSQVVHELQKMPLLIGVQGLCLNFVCTDSVLQVKGGAGWMRWMS